MTKEEKEKLELEHSKTMNDEAVKRIKDEVLTEEQSNKQADVFFEEDEKFRLRDGKEYFVPPASLKNARRMMKILGTINMDAIIVNFIPTGNDEEDQKREDNLFEILQMAFVNYPEIDRDFIDEKVDLESARKIIETLIGLNGLKKSM